MGTETATETSTLSDRVLELIGECLYDEPAPSTPPADAVLVEGIAVKGFGFDPKKVKSNRSKIEALIFEIVPEAFYTDGGGGMSFLSLAHSKTGELWTGYHRTMEALVVLAIAIGKARYCAPREMWRLLPGSMPYVQFDRTAPREFVEAGQGI